MKTVLQAKVLRWARLRAGLSEADLAAKLGREASDVAEWEQSGAIERKLVEKLADATKTPFGYLFLSDAPREALPITDFRRGKGAASAPSQALLSTIYQCQRRQDWFKQYLLTNGAKPLPFMGSITVDFPVIEAARQIAGAIKIGPDHTQGCETWEEAMRVCIENIEDARILVNKIGFAESNTHNKLSVDEFRGFALSDEYAPLIFINGADASAAQRFTLTHEVVHIWLGVSGVSNLAETYVASDRIEGFCNSVAAEILVPLRALEAEWNRSNLAINEVSRLAKQFKVSRIVMARRAKDADRLSQADYVSFYRMETKPSSRDRGGNFYNTKPYETSRRLSIALLKETRDGRTMFSEAMDLLGIRNSATFQKYAEHLQVAW